MGKIRYNYDDNSGVSYKQKPSKRSLWGLLWIALLFVVALIVYFVFFGSKDEPEKTEPAKQTPAAENKNVQPAAPVVQDKPSAPVAVKETPVEKYDDEEAVDYPLGAVTLDQVPKLRTKETDRLFAKAVADTDYQAAKTLLLKELSALNNKNSLYFRTLAKYLRALNMKILFDGVPGGKTFTYIIRPGDSLSRISTKHSLPLPVIKSANKITNNTIYPGQGLKIYRGKWSIEVSKADKLLYVYDEKDLFAIYDIGIGKEGRTPVGDFILVDKIEKPSWYSPDGKIYKFGEKENVLGTHWLKIDPAGDTDKAFVGYGIHGTWDKGSITKSMSNGCVRMVNEEVGELFNYIPRRTPVKIY